jgi:cell division protein ZapA
MNDSELKPIVVQILDKEYWVNCSAEEQEALHASARYLSDKMREIRHTGKIIGADRIAVMAALNIAHELLELRKQQEGLSYSFNARLHALQNRLEVALEQNKPAGTGGSFAK